uniref:Ribosomal protein L16 n=1 Tax=Capsaspora owczarzaki TaxID=192875 RepID=M1KF81_9EUKA|nr:ribosomal protein L16 [Capsaspora owczarzaki]
MDYRQIKPRKTKYPNTQKSQKGRVSKYLIKSGASLLQEGIIGLRALEPGRLSAKELGSVIVYLRRKLKKVCKITLRTFPDIGITKKPAESRLGGGKGALEFWGARCRKNQIIFELTPTGQEWSLKQTSNRDNVFIENAISSRMEKALIKASTKLRIKTVVVYKLPAVITTQISLTHNLSSSYEI